MSRQAWQPVRLVHGRRLADRTAIMLRSLLATGVQYVVAFLVGLPIFAGFKLARRLFSHDAPAPGQG